MSSTLARRADLPHLSPRWTTSDAAAAQGDRNEGIRAARDGTDNTKALERFWRRLTSEGASDLLRLYSECARLLDDQSARRERLRHELDTDLVNQAATNQRHYDERIGTLKRELGPDAPMYRERTAKAEDVQKALRIIRGEVNSRPLRTQFGLFYYVIMLTLALAEVPVNRAAFELTFREEPVFSLLLAAAVGLILIFFAHVVGLFVRRWPHRLRAGQIAARIASLALILGVVGAGVYVMAKMRQGFMQLISAENEGFAQRLQQALRGEHQETVSITANAPLTINDWTFIAVNVLIFMVGVVASFLHHDPHPDYEKAVREARKAEHAFAKVEKQYGDAVRVETARYEERKRSLERQMGELRATMAALADQSDGVREHCASARQMVAQTVRRRCGIFIDGFSSVSVSSARSSLAVPSIDTVLADLPTLEAVTFHVD